jgi:hypothetical protein
MTNQPKPNDLHRPGAGLPPFEKIAVGSGFKIFTAFATDRYVLKKFRREAREVLRLAEGDESYDPFQTVKVPRLFGIEHSSCNWSVMMTLEHLCMTTFDMLKIIKALHSGVAPRGAIDIADYKPANDVGFEVLDRFRQVELSYGLDVEAMIESQGRLVNGATYLHPWFGLINAHQWHCLAAVHLQIHRRQMQKIIAILGVT